MLYCPNYNCQAANPETHPFCERCQTPLPKRYLWVVGQMSSGLAPGQVLAERYVCKSPRIVLDTRPGLPPSTLSQFPQTILPYLRLAAYRLHVPQAYGWVQLDSSQGNPDVLFLLEEAAIALSIETGVAAGRFPPQHAVVGHASEPSVQPLPTLTEQWASASAMRQLNWLWQIAKLWQPFATEHVVSSLLNPNLIRVEDHLVRLLELQFDSQRSTEGVGASLLTQLGTLWSQWIPQAKPAISPFLKALCQHLVEGKIEHPGQLVACCDRALEQAGQSQVRQIQIATQTDRGPSRPRNEDACYPVESPLNTFDSRTPPDPLLDSSLVVVCDGIGGHLGGDVASRLAIDAFYKHLRGLPLGRMSPLALITELRRATCVANDVISERNDEENRRDRERMGTTLVMGLLQNHELYVTHLGDSRAYVITRWGCHQATLDDDVASREVRLGYSTYRSALYQPSSGSLVQALGMGSSGMLHPTVQRLLLEGEGIILFCSDGLSDNDLVESIGQSLVMPLLEGKTDINTVAQQLISAANQHNGHDNVTVGLMHWKTSHPTPFQVSADLAHPRSLTTSPPRSSQSTHIQANQKTAIQEANPADETAKTRIVAPVASRQRPEVSASGASPAPAGPTESLSADSPTLRPSEPASSPDRRFLPLVLGIFFLLSLGGALAYLLLPSVSDRIDTLLGIEQPEQPVVEDTLSLPNGENRSSDNQGLEPLTPDLTIGTLIQVLSLQENDRPDDTVVRSLLIYPEPSQLSANRFSTSETVPALPPDSPTDSTVPPTNPAVSSAPESTALSQPITTPALIPDGSILKVLQKQEDSEQGRWVRLQVCFAPVSDPAVSVSSAESGSGFSSPQSSETSLPSTESVPLEVVSPGDVGWMLEEDLQSAAAANPELTPEQQGVCQVP